MSHSTDTTTSKSILGRAAASIRRTYADLDRASQAMFTIKDGPRQF